MTLKCSKLYKYSLTLAFALSLVLPVSAVAATSKNQASKPAVTKTVLKKAVAKSKTTKKPAPKKKQPVKKAPKLQKWVGVITGVENSETFYLKLNYKNNRGELTVKVTPETKFVRLPVAASIGDFDGGDQVEVEGVKLDSRTIRASTIKYLSNKYKDL